MVARRSGLLVWGLVRCLLGLVRGRLGLRRVRLSLMRGLSLMRRLSLRSRLARLLRGRLRAGLSGQRRGLGATCATALLMFRGEAGVGVGLWGLLLWWLLLRLPGLRLGWLERRGVRCEVLPCGVLRSRLRRCWLLLRRDLGRGGGGGLLGADHRVVEAGRRLTTPATLRVFRRHPLLFPACSVKPFAGSG